MNDLNIIKENINKGNYKKSINDLELLIKKNNKDINALYFLAVCFYKIHDYVKSVSIYNKLIKEKNNPIFFINIAKIYIKKNEFKLAEIKLVKSTELYPKNFEILNLLGISLALQNKEILAIKYFKQSLSIKKNYLDPIYNLLELYEKTNNFQELEKLISVKIKIFPEDKIILYYKTFIYEKNNEFEKAKGAIFDKNFLSINLDWGVKKEFRMGQLFYKNKEYGKSFKSYKAGNKIILENISSEVLIKNEFIKTLNKIIDQQKNTSNILIKNTKIKNDLNLIFHIGFPRSGTTLIDTILNSHSQVTVVEEIPIIEGILKKIRKIKFQNILEKQERAKKLYLESLEIHKTRNYKNTEIVVDKLPLNLVRIKELNELFPQSKILMSIRHPLDCILSCFIQNFQLNSAMINFLDINQTAKMYDKVMQIWKYNIDKIQVPICNIKYEDLISNSNKEIGKILKFLEIKDEDNLRGYKEKLLDRDRIRTPSYNQVTQPIYSSSVFKWKHYEKDLIPIKPIAEKWIEYFKY